MNTRLSALMGGSPFAGEGLTMLIDAAVKGFVLFSLAIVVTFALRRASAATRHLVWFTALVCSLVLPLGAWVLPKWQALPKWVSWQEVSPRISAQPLPAPAPVAQEINSEPPAEAEAPIVLPSSNITAPPLRTEPSPRVSPVWLGPQLILFVWTTGAAVLIAPLFYSFVALWRRSTRSQRITSGELLNVVHGLRRELHLRRKVHLLLGNEDAMPMVWGIFRVRLLLPSSATTWTPSRLRGVLLHELGHLRRHDPLSTLIAQLALAVHWFNPLAWFAVRQLRAEQELACDDYVLRHGVRASDYASDLVAVVTDFRPVALATSALTMAHPSRLEGRIIGILDVRRNRRALTRWLVAAAGLIAISVAVPLAMLRAADESAKQQEKNTEAPRQRGSMHGIEMDLARMLKVTTAADAAEIEIEAMPGQLVLIAGEGEGARIVAHNFGVSKKPIFFRAGADDRKGRWWDQVRFVREGESDGMIPSLPDGWMPAGRIVFMPAPVKGSAGAEIIAEITSESGKVPLAVRGITGAELSKVNSRQIPATFPETRIAVSGTIHALGKDAPAKPLKLPVMAAQDLIGRPRDALSFPSMRVQPGFPAYFYRRGYDADQIDVTADPTPDGVRINGKVSVPLLTGKYESAREAWKRNEESLDKAGSEPRETTKLHAEFSATLGRNDALVFPIPSEGLFPDTLVVSLTAEPRKESRPRWFPPEQHPELVLDGWVFTWPRTEHEWFSRQFDYKGLAESITRHVNDRKVPPGNSVTSEAVDTMEPAEVDALVEAFRKRPDLKLDRVEPFVAKQPKAPFFLTQDDRTLFTAGGARASVTPTFDGTHIMPNIRWLDPVFEYRNMSSAYAVNPGSSVCVLLPGPANPAEIRMLVLRCGFKSSTDKKEQNPPQFGIETPRSPDTRPRGGAKSFLGNVGVSLLVGEPPAPPREALSMPAGSLDAFQKGWSTENKRVEASKVIPGKTYRVVIIQEEGKEPSITHYLP